MIKTLTIAVALMGLAVGAQAATIGYWDAAAPGAAPGTTFEGMVNGYNFANTSGVTHVDNAGTANDYYDFTDPGGAGNGDRMDGTGNENLYDWATDDGDGAGNGKPFTIVFYGMMRAGETPQIITKTDEPGDGQFLGWAWHGNSDGNGRWDIAAQPGDNANRLYTRTGDHGNLNVLTMMVMSSGGSGTNADIQWYTDGSATGTTYAQNALNATVTNSNHLVLGESGFGGTAGANGTNMQLHFIEILDEAVDQTWVTNRWIGGAPARGLDYIPEPATMALLGLGGLMVLRRRRRA